MPDARPSRFAEPVRVGLLTPYFAFFEARFPADFRSWTKTGNEFSPVNRTSSQPRSARKVTPSFHPMENGLPLETQQKYR